MFEKLKELDVKELKGGKELDKIAKSLVEGEDVTLTCYIIKGEHKLGRSIVADLNAPLDDNVRQVDHRSIEYIIFKNTKYVLSKGKKKTGREEEEEKKEADKKKWDSKKL